MDTGGFPDSINSIGVPAGVASGVADVDTVSWPPSARSAGDVLPVLTVGPVNVDRAQAGAGSSAVNDHYT